MSTTSTLTPRQREVLEIIEAHMRERGYPPSVREIGEAVGLTSPSTVHAHLAALQKRGYLRRDPTKPRAIEVRWDPTSDAVVERRPVRHVPLVGDVAAGTDVLAQENVEEVLPLPADFTGEGDLFMLRVRGDSMIDAGILDGDYVIVVQQATAANGDVVVAGIPGEEATVKTYLRKGTKVVLQPANERLTPMEFEAAGVQVLACSCDTRFAQAQWATQQGYQFPVLSDFWPHGETARAFGVFNEDLGCAIRATFLIDRNGTVADTFSTDSLGTARAKERYTEALATL